MSSLRAPSKKYLRIFAILSVLWGSSCSTDRPAGTGTEEWIFAATISGSPDLVDLTGTAYYSDSHILSIIGGGYLGAGRRAIEVKAAGVSAPGVFDVAVGINSASYGESGPGGQSWRANFEYGSGTLTVTEFSQTRVVASFRFTAYADSTLASEKVVVGTCTCRIQLLSLGTP